jgi:hypothetical protein
VAALPTRGVIAESAAWSTAPHIAAVQCSSVATPC